LTTKKADNKKQTFRSMRMENSVKKFLSGESRRAYFLREDIARGLKDAQINPCTNGALKSIADSPCSCSETLQKFTDMFSNMLHTGQSLVKRASGQQPNKPKNKTPFGRIKSETAQFEYAYPDNL